MISARCGSFAPDEPSIIEALGDTLSEAELLGAAANLATMALAVIATVVPQAAACRAWSKGAVLLGTNGRIVAITASAALGKGG